MPIRLKHNVHREELPAPSGSTTRNQRTTTLGIRRGNKVTHITDETSRIRPTSIKKEKKSFGFKHAAHTRTHTKQRITHIRTYAEAARLPRSWESDSRVFFAAILSILLVAAASALADNRDSSEASAAPQAATNPANVIFRILEAPSGGAAVRQQLVHHHHDARPVTYVLHQQPAAQPVFTRFVQHQPAPIQPVFARIVQQPVIAAPAPVPVPVIRTVTQQQQQTAAAATSAELGPVDPNPSYTFGYEVNAVEDHVHKGHKESRSNGEVTGEYRYVDPNGDLRITTYTAGVNGYNAEVEIQKGYASPAPAPRKQPQQQQIVVAAPAPVPAPVPIVRHVHAPVPASTVYRLVSGGHHQQLLATNPHTLVRAVSLPVAAPALRHTGGATFTRIVHTDGTTTEF